MRCARPTACFALALALAGCTADNPDYLGAPDSALLTQGTDAGLPDGAALDLPPLLPIDFATPELVDLALPGCGGDNQPCCANGGCANGGCCATGTCHAANSDCGGNLGVCTNGMCQVMNSCGGVGQGCCGNLGSNYCTAPDSVCQSSGLSASCVACGGAGQPCCAGSRCQGGGCCVTSGFGATPACVAAGKACTNGGQDLCQMGSCGGCGAVGQDCCGSGLSRYCSAAGSVCNDAIGNPKCDACGQKGQACCDNSACAGGLTCQLSLQGQSCQ